MNVDRTRSVSLKIYAKQGLFSAVEVLVEMMMIIKKVVCKLVCFWVISRSISSRKATLSPNDIGYISGMPFVRSGMYV